MRINFQRWLWCFFLILNLFAGMTKADIIGSQSKIVDVDLPETVKSELPPELAEQLKPLMQLYARNDFSNFKSAYLKIASATNLLPAPEIFWTKLLIMQNRLSDAIKLLEEYAIAQQEDPELYVWLGVLAVRSGRITDAWLHLLYAQRLLDRVPIVKERQKQVLPAFLEARVLVAEKRRQWAECEQMYVRLQALNPEDHLVKWRTGRLQVLSGNIKAGHATMMEACANQPTLPRASLAVAQLLSETTQWSKDADAKKSVEGWFTQAIKENNTDPTAWAAYFKWLLLDNRPQLVAEMFEKLPQPAKEHRDVIIIRSVAARYMDDLVMAEKLLTPLHQAQQDDLEVSDQLALVFVESMDEAKRGRALQLSERNLRAAGDIETIAATAGWVQLQLGSTDVADKIFSAIAARGPLSAQTTYYVTELLRRNGRDAESGQLLKVALDTVGLFPQRAKAKELLAQNLANPTKDNSSIRNKTEDTPAQNQPKPGATANPESAPTAAPSASPKTN